MIKKATLTQVLNQSIKTKTVTVRNIPVRDATACVDTIFKTIAEALIRGEKIELREFGAFSVKNIPQRKKYPNGVIPAHGSIVFKPSQKLKQAVWNRVK